MLEEVETYLYALEKNNWTIERKSNTKYYLTGYFDTSQKSSLEINSIKKMFPDIKHSFEINVIEKISWENEYKKYLKKWSCGNLNWIPLWMKQGASLNPNEKNVYIDAGMAFGTGSHETTRLCAARLLSYSKNLLPKDHLLIVDAGCGSGILSLSASALGFKKIMGFDLDPNAIKVCEAHLKVNSHLKNIRFKVGGLTSCLNKNSVHFLMANIEAFTLKENAYRLLTSLKKNSQLILSGILNNELPEITRVYKVAAKKVFPSSIINLESSSLGQWSDLMIEIIPC